MQTVEREVTAADLSRAVAAARRATERCSWLWEDAYSDACLALFRAARDFDGRGTFEGYSGQRMRWAALDAVKHGLGSKGSAGQAIRTAVPLSALTEPGDAEGQAAWVLVA